MATTVPTVQSRNGSLVASVVAAVGVAGVLIGMASAGMLFRARLSSAEARNQELRVALRQTQTALASAEALARAAAKASAQEQAPHAQPQFLVPSSVGPAAPAVTSAPAAVAPQPKMQAAQAAHADRAKPVAAPRDQAQHRSIAHTEIDSDVAARRKIEAEALALQAARVRAAEQATIPETQAAQRGAPPEKAALQAQSVSAARDAAHPLQAVSAEAAGLRSLDAQGVVLATGQRVAVGGNFPSGERLLAVDPKDNEVVTSRRTLVLFFGRPTKP